MRGRLTAVIVSGAIVALLGGCGDDDAPIETISTEAETTETTSGVSQEEFISSADAACAEANVALGNLGTDSDSLAIDQRLGITQEVLSAIESLGAPEDPNGDLQDFTGALRDQISILEEQQDAASGGDTVTADSLSTELDAAEAEAQSAAEAYGFEECGQPPSASTTTTPSGGTTPGTTDPAVTDPGAVTPTTTAPAPVAPEPAPEPTAPTGGAGVGESPAPEPEPPADHGGGSSGGFSP